MQLILPKDTNYVERRHHHCAYEPISSFTHTHSHSLEIYNCYCKVSLKATNNHHSCHINTAQAQHTEYMERNGKALYNHQMCVMNKLYCAYGLIYANMHAIVDAIERKNCKELLAFFSPLKRRQNFIGCLHKPYKLSLAICLICSGYATAPMSTHYNYDNHILYIFSRLLLWCVWLWATDALNIERDLPYAGTKCDKLAEDVVCYFT